MKKQESLKIRVKKKLWRFGYSVKDMQEVGQVNFPFDLLVESKVRVKVGDGKPEAMPRECDVYAYETDAPQIRFVLKTRKGMIERVAVTSVFGIKNN